jgi:hypothetical protein
MQSNISKLRFKDDGRDDSATNYCVGTLLEIDDTGRPVVDFPGNVNGPLIARTLVQIPARSDDPNKESQPIVLIFENGNPRFPIIAGFVHDTLYSKNEDMILPIHPSEPKELIVDKERILLNARQEVVIRCGKCSINLQKNGKAIIKGVQIVSRASRSNKIRGANVTIN